MAFEFQCKDANGTEHVYSGDLHKGSMGAAIVRQLLGLIVEPLSAALGPVAMATLSNPNVKSIKDIGLSSLGNLDLSSVGHAMQSALTGMTDRLMWDILRFTNRDGAPLVNAETGRPTMTLDEAYAANYLELGKALWEVCSANGFFAGADTFASAAKKARALMPEMLGKLGSSSAPPQS